MWWWEGGLWKKIIGLYCAYGKCTFINKTLRAKERGERAKSTTPATLFAYNDRDAEANRHFSSRDFIDNFLTI